MSSSSSWLLLLVATLSTLLPKLPTPKGGGGEDISADATVSGANSTVTRLSSGAAWSTAGGGEVGDTGSWSWSTANEVFNDADRSFGSPLEMPTTEAGDLALVVAVPVNVLLAVVLLPPVLDVAAPVFLAIPGLTVVGVEEAKFRLGTAGEAAATPPPPRPFATI